MPNIASSKKRVRTTAKRTSINTARKTRVRGFIRKVEEAIASGDQKAALAALKAAEPEIMRGVSKGILHKNTGARKVSRLSKRVTKLAKWEAAGILENYRIGSARSNIRAFFICPCAELHQKDTFRRRNTDDYARK